MDTIGKRLQAKDLINVGIFTVIYLVLAFAAMMLGYIPIFVVLITIICPIIGGIPFMLYVTRIRKFGMVTLTGVICGLLMMVMGSGVFVFITGIVFGLLGDLIMKSGKYKSFKCSVLGYSVFSLWIMGFVSRMYLTRDAYFSNLAAGYGQEYVETLMGYTPVWMYPVMFALTFIGGLIGAFLGTAVLKKHFAKAGIA